MAVIHMTNLNRVRTLLGLPDIETKYDELLMQIIADTTAEAESYLHRSVEAKERTEQYDLCNGQYILQVASFPISAVANIWNDYARTFGSSTIVASTGYYVNNDWGMIYFDKINLTAGRGMLKIQYTGGMATSTNDFMAKFPDITSAITMEVSTRYQRRMQTGLIAATASGGSVTVAQKPEFLPLVAEVLDRHVRYR